MEKLKVFLSWSGPRSKAVAEALRTWLPDVLPMTDPWLSAADIEPGAKWRQAISGELETTNFAILCLTPGNLLSPWLLFEAGALSKHSDARVCTYLVDLNPTDVKDPLSQFQHTRANLAETKQLVATINKKQEFALDEGRLDRTFERWWPDLEKLLGALPPESTDLSPRNPMAKVPEMVAEILERVREQNRQARPADAIAAVRPEDAALREALMRETDFLREKAKSLDLNEADISAIFRALSLARDTARMRRYEAASRRIGDAKTLLEKAIRSRGSAPEEATSEPVDPPNQ